MLHVPTYLRTLRSPHYAIPHHTPLQKKGMTCFTGANFLLHKLLRTPVNSATNKLRQCKQITTLPLIKRHAVAHWLRHCATRCKVALSNHDGVIQNFHWHNPTGRTIPVVDSASNTNEYKEYFLGLKAAGAYGSTFKRRIKYRLPLAGIIRHSPYSPHFQDRG